MKLPSQESAAAQLLRAIAVDGELLPFKSELAAALQAADSLASLDWHIDVALAPSRHFRGPRHPDAGLVAFSVRAPANFLDWCETVQGRHWLAGVPADASNDARVAA